MERSISQCQNRLLRGKLHEIERLEERGSGTVPIADTFLATAIIGITLHKGSQALLHSFEGCIALLGILLADEHSLQPVGGNPGIPVVGIVLPALRLEGRNRPLPCIISAITRQTNCFLIPKLASSYRVRLPLVRNSAKVSAGMAFQGFF